MVVVRWLCINSLTCLEPVARCATAVRWLHRTVREHGFYYDFTQNVKLFIFHQAPPPFLPAGSVYRDEFDLAILKMQEDNRLEILKRKWWDGGKCPKEEDHRAKGSSAAASLAPLWFTSHLFHYNSPHLALTSLHMLLSPGLGMENIGGIFVVLVCGLLVAIFMAVLEFVWMLRQAPGNEVREGYLTCICFVSLSSPWHPPPPGAARLSSFQL